MECPKCGRSLDPEVAEPAVPWHFKLLVVATVAYLAYRAYQGGLWLLQRM